MQKFRRKRGFERASSLVANRVRAAGETRGFAVSRLLTHWDDIVGPDLAPRARPVEVGYGKSFGATLTLLCSGPNAPIVEMQKEQIRERVNACYGYSAIARVRITQTSAHGFAEQQAAFESAPKPNPAEAPEVRAKARQAAEAVGDDTLRQALERLGANILSQSKQT